MWMTSTNFKYWLPIDSIDDSLCGSAIKFRGPLIKGPKFKMQSAAPCNGTQVPLIPQCATDEPPGKWQQNGNGEEASICKKKYVYSMWVRDLCSPRGAISGKVTSSLMRHCWVGDEPRLDCALGIPAQITCMKAAGGSAGGSVHCSMGLVSQRILRRIVHVCVRPMVWRLHFEEVSEV